MSSYEGISYPRGFSIASALAVTVDRIVLYYVFCANRMEISSFFFFFFWRRFGEIFARAAGD